MTTPVRLRLSRLRGFDLQAHSRAVNGLPAVNVARPSAFGNMWKVGTWSNYLGRVCANNADAVECFRSCGPPSEPHLRAIIIEELRGKNLACWCALDAPCHATVLLEIANRPTCEAVDACDRLAVSERQLRDLTKGRNR